MNVAIVAIDGTFDSGLSTVMDTLAMANELAQQTGIEPHFAVSLVGVRDHIRTQHGLAVPTRRPDEVDHIDLAVVPALGEKTPDTLEAALRRDDVRDARNLLVDLHESGAKLAAACTGTYVLASSGLLDGRAATTTWWLGRDFATRFPAVELRDTQMVIADNGRVTAGAALAHVDLALWLVRAHSPSLASLTSRYLLVDDRNSQATYAMRDHLAHADPLVERFERWARDHLADFTMASAARAVGSSERTLERRVRKVLNRTPIAYVRDLRVQHAVMRLETSDDSVDDIAEAVGYSDGTTLRTLLRDKTGRGIRELRRVE